MRTTKSKSQLLFEKSKMLYFNTYALGIATRRYNAYVYNDLISNYDHKINDYVSYVHSLVYKPNAYNTNSTYLYLFVKLSLSIFLDFIGKYNYRFLFFDGAFKSFMKKIVNHNISIYNSDTREFDFVPFDFENLFK